MMRTQRGMTTIGLILSAGIAFLIVFAALRLVPVYLEYMKVAGVLESVHQQLNNNDPSVQDIQNAVGRRLDIEMVSAVKRADFKVSRQGRGYQLRVAYSHTAPYIGNVSFLVEFDKAVEIAK